MNNRKNFITALAYQLIHIAYGFIVPRLILASFGSNINGLVSSITQFLSFISLLEGGLGAVVLAELYKPIEDNDIQKVRGILFSCRSFFRRLALIFVLYTIILAFVYSFSIKQEYSVDFTFSLILILSLTTLAQYLFSITHKLFLQANQQLYIINIVTSSTLLVNIIVAIIVIKVFPEIHVLKLASSIAFFIQPLVLKHFIGYEFKTLSKREIKRIELKNRWSGFAQNLAHFINMNTDIAIITVFSSLENVSVYSVYMLAITALRAIVTSITNSYQSALGKYLAQGNAEILKDKFKKFCIGTWGIAIILFSTCLLMINPFVSIYTTNINDANYYQPLFALVIVLANLVYCLREPFRLLILAAGKFKETNFGAIIEAVINVALSLLLITRFELLGVAIGTFIAIAFRTLYFIFFLRKEIINLRIWEYRKYIIVGTAIVVLNIILYFAGCSVKIGLVSFVFIGILVALFESIIIFVFFIGIKETIGLIKQFVRK